MLDLSLSGEQTVYTVGGAGQGFSQRGTDRVYSRGAGQGFSQGNRAVRGGAGRCGGVRGDPH